MANSNKFIGYAFRAQNWGYSVRHPARRPLDGTSAANAAWESWFFLPATSGTTTVTVSAGVVTYTPQQINTNAQRFVSVVTAVETYSPQNLTTNVRTSKVITSVVEAYTGITVVVNAKRFLVVIPGIIQMLPMPTNVNAGRRLAVTNATVTYTPVSVPIKSNKSVFVTAGLEQYQGQAIIVSNTGGGVISKPYRKINLSISLGL